METVHSTAAIDGHTFPRAKITMTPDGRLNRADAARFIGLSAKTLANRNARGLGPKSVKVGGRRFYWLSDLQAFIGSKEAR